MRTSMIKPQMVITSKIRVDAPTFIMLFPDEDTSIKEAIYGSNILLSNCLGLISPNNAFKFYNKKINNRTYVAHLRKDLMSKGEDESGKRIKLLTDLPLIKNSFQKNNETKKEQYYFYDLSMYTRGLNMLSDKISERMLTKIVFQYLTDVYGQIKTNFPLYNVELMFLMKKQNTLLYSILSNLRILMPKKNIEEITFFDTYTFANNLGNTMPLIEKKNGKNNIIIKNFSNLSGFIPSDESGNNEERDIINTKKSIKIDGEEKPEDIFKQDIEPKTKYLQSIASNLKEDVKKDEINVDVNVNELKSILSKYKIKDSTVLANTKVALDYYKQKTDLDKKDEEDIPKLVLKAIHYTVHGTDEIREDYLHNPSLLINKIKEIKTYQVPLEFPNNEHIIDPKDIIDIKQTSGQFRQKFEYSEAVHENVEKLFSTIEKLSNHPVKIKKIDYDIIDNDRDRLIHYKITLQNITGENKTPYTVELKVPSIVNDRYFKLHGKTYIQANQQVLKPITKTDKSEVRLLSNYAIIHVKIKNIKFNPADISQIINYIKVKYPKIIKKSDYSSYISFTDKSTIYMIGDTIYESPKKTIKIDDKGKIIDHENNVIKYGKNELLFELIRSKIQNENPEDRLSTTKKNIPYLEIYLSGISIPLIIYLWSQKGLITTLTDLEIEYRKIDNKKDVGKNEILISLEDGTFVACKYNNVREELILNGILAAKVKNIPTDLDNPEIIYEHISNVYGSRSLVKINLITENQIDPITKELLEFEGMNTNFPNLVSNEMVDILLNKKPDSLADLSIYRSRLSEIVLNLMYKQITMAHNKYRSEAELNIDNSKIYLDPNFIVNSMLGEVEGQQTSATSLLQHTEPYNPIDEIMLASKAVKTGKGIGGVPTKRAFKTQHRNIHESHYGNLGAISTPESSNVGLILHHTLNPIISNKWGSYGGKDITSLSGWNILTLDESLIMFQSSMDSDRACMARAHLNQTVPINNAESPLVMTGGEFLVPQLSSKRFIQKAKKDGKITELVENKYATVEYNDGTKEVFDLLPRDARTKRGSILSLQLYTEKNVGDKIQKNEVLAHTKNFNNTGIYASGKNVRIAIMNYQGYSHEDAYVISDKLATETTTDVIKEITTVIPPNAKLLNIEKTVGKQVNANDILLEFVYDQDLDEYIEAYDLDSSIDLDNEEIVEKNNEDIIYSKGQDSIKLLASLNGEIVDFKIYINNKKVTDNSVVNLHSELVNEDKKLIKKLQKDKKDVTALDNIKTDYMKIGGHKLKGGKIYEGAKIVYSIKYKKTLQAGDKIANRSALKGVISRILKDTPKGEFTDEIDVFVSPIGIFSRKNMSILKELYIGKIFYYLKQQCKEMADDSKTKTDEIINKILKIYELLSTDKVYKSVSKKIKQVKQSLLRESLQNETFDLFFVVEPFTNVTFDQIRKAAKVLNIPLDEKVYIPELDTWTSEPVPVGIAYYQFLEHYSDVYSNVRGSEKYVGLTRAPTRGKSKQGGQALGSLDVNALITLDAHNIINEMFTFRSDEHIAKREMYSNIIQNGELVDLPRKQKSGGTHKIFDIYMTSLGLQIKN